MKRLCPGLILAALLPLIVTLGGCAGTGTTGTPVSDLRVPPNQMVQAQQLADGSFSVCPQALIAIGGAPLSGYTWSLPTGSAYPPGTTVSALTGVFHGSGNGLEAGRDYLFDVRVSDGTRSASGTIRLRVARYPDDGIVGLPVFQQPMGVPVIRLQDGRANSPYGASLHVSGGTPPYSWFEDAGYAGRGDFALSGLTIDMARGVVRGTIMNSAAGKTLRFRITVRDNTDAIAATDGVGPVYEIRVQ